MIMETIHVKFDELTGIASEHNCLEPDSNIINFEDPSVKPSHTPSKEDLDNLFGLMYEKYFEGRTPNVSTSDNFAASDNLNANDTSSLIIIIVDVNEAPHIENMSIGAERCGNGMMQGEKCTKKVSQEETIA
ncbi:hypothetical protein Tco_0543599 [Tanacetum coccineum]